MAARVYGCQTLARIYFFAIVISDFYALSIKKAKIDKSLSIVAFCFFMHDVLLTGFECLFMYVHQVMSINQVRHNWLFRD